MLSSLPRLGFFALTALVFLTTSCAGIGNATAPRLATRASEARELTPAHYQAPKHVAGMPHAVVTAAERIFVLTGEHETASASGEKLLLAGGWSLEVAPRGPSAPGPFTLVGPDGQCVAKTKRRVSVRLDLGGYSGASLPTGAEKAIEVEGCADLARAGGFLLAVPGSDEHASWLHPAHVDDAPAPADRRLGENEVWLHRFALPESELEIVERSVLRYATPSCSEEQRELILVDELGKPVESYPDFELRGALSAGGHVLLVLTGHDDPEALRVVELGEASARVTLDTRVAAFEDTAHAGC